MIPFASALTYELMVGESYWESHRWPFACSMLVAGVATASLGGWLNTSRKTKQLFDPETGRGVTVAPPPKHSTFWMPMEWWGALLVVIGVFSLFFDLTKI